MFISKRKTLQMNKLLGTPMTAPAKEQTNKQTKALQTKTGLGLVSKSQLPGTSHPHSKALAKSTVSHFSRFQNQMIEENAVLFFRISMSGKAGGWWKEKPRWRHDCWGLGIRGLYNLFLFVI